MACLSFIKESRKELSAARKYCFLLINCGGIFVLHIIKVNVVNQGKVFLGHRTLSELLCFALAGNSDHMFYYQSLRA